jgi:hypothetical protein
MKMEVLGWLARHSDWLAAARLADAVAGFMDWAETNAQAVKKAPGPQACHSVVHSLRNQRADAGCVQTDAVRYVVDALKDPSFKRRSTLLSLLECLLKSGTTWTVFLVLSGC